MVSKVDRITICPFTECEENAVIDENDAVMSVRITFPRTDETNEAIRHSLAWFRWIKDRHNR